MMNSNYHILFDYDGVITQKTDFAKHASSKHGVDENEIRLFFKENLKNCLIGKNDIINTLSKYLNKIGWDGTAKQLFHILYLEEHHYNEELVEFIKTSLANSYHCHIATNQDIHRLNIIKEEAFIKHHFHHVFCSCEFGVAKPNSDYFKKIHSFLQTKDSNLKKEQLIFIDDLHENIESAENYDIQSHLFEDTQKLKLFINNVIDGNSFPALKSGNISLIKMKFSHSNGYSDILSDPNTYHFLTESGPIDEQKALNKITRNRNSFDTGNSIYWSITNNNNDFMGFVAIHNFHQHNTVLSFGVHPSFRRQGIASKTINIILNWDGLKGKSVELATHLENHASFNLLSKMNLLYKGLNDTKFGQRHVFIREGKTS